MSRYHVDEADLEKLRGQLQTLRATYGIGGTSPEPVTFEEMNAIFGPEHMERFINKLEWNLEVALRLIATTEKERFKDEIGF